MAAGLWCAVVVVNVVNTQYLTVRLLCGASDSWRWETLAESHQGDHREHHWKGTVVCLLKRLVTEVTPAECMLICMWLDYVTFAICCFIPVHVSASATSGEAIKEYQS